MRLLLEDNKYKVGEVYEGLETGGGPAAGNAAGNEAEKVVGRFRNGRVKKCHRRGSFRPA